MNNIVNVKSVIVADAPDAHQVWLDVGCQHFTVGEYCETKDEAEWLAAQLRIALTALQAGAGDGWQHIESAPKDGTKVFVYVPGDSNYPTAAYYSSKEYFETEYGDPDYMDEGWYWSFGYPSDFHEETIEPTHWMPIPESPEAIDNAQATEEK